MNCRTFICLLIVSIVIFELALCKRGDGKKAKKRGSAKANKLSKQAKTRQGRPYHIVKRPGKTPLKCYKEGGKARCVEMPFETAQRGGGKVKDTHDVEKGPLGGKLYKVGDSYIECFSNGECFGVNEKDGTGEPESPTTTKGEQHYKIVKRPGKKPLKCYKKGEKSVCKVIEFEEAKKEGGRIKDPHKVKKGPLGGKLYKLGKSYMECFANGQCFEVNKKELSTTTPAPAVDDNEGDELDEDKLDKEKGPLGGKLYKMGDIYMECLPNGKCFAVNKDDLVAEPEPVTELQEEDGKFYRKGGEILECFSNSTCVTLSFVDGKESCPEHCCDAKPDAEDKLTGDKNDENNPDHQENEPDDDEDNEDDNDDDNDDENPDDYMSGYWEYVDVDDEDFEFEYQDDGENGTASGKAICSFSNSDAVKGSIILIDLENTQNKMEVIGKLNGLKEGIHVLTFHEEGDVETEGCKGVGGYHRPSSNTHFHERNKRSPLPQRLIEQSSPSLQLPIERSQRHRRQIELFAMAQSYMDNAYEECQSHVASCKANELPSDECKTNLQRCVPILKCKRCRSTGKEALDTVGDLEKTGHFHFASQVPRNSLFVYADEKGEASFDEFEKEQTLHGDDSVMGRSIVLSSMPEEPNGNFNGIACCRIEPPGNKIVFTL